MSTFNQRLNKLITEKLNITKTEFAKTCKVTPSYISKLVVTGTPSDILLDTICSKYNVNKQWLEHGIGEPLVSHTVEEETYGRFGNLMEHASREKRAFVSSLINLIDRLPDEEFNKLTEEYQKALKESQEES